MASGILAGKVALVTGATGGIGRAAAVGFAREGAVVIAAARREDKGAELVSEIAAAGGQAAFVRTDISSIEDIDSLFAYIDRKWGRLDAALNNAAAEAPPAFIVDTTLETFETMFAANVRGTYWCLRHELQRMTKQASGSIVNVGSVAGVAGLPQHSVYVSAKHAVVGMTKTAALEVAESGVRVNCLCPGPVRTEMFSRWTNDIPEIVAALAADVPVKRVAASEEIARTAAWLLSENASYITGAIIMADGGMTAG
jgi:NAD(P)-dependent dehydrogenase (short-subunit alcohol dehydrogenase family)